MGKRKLAGYKLVDGVALYRKLGRVLRPAEAYHQGDSGECYRVAISILVELAMAGIEAEVVHGVGTCQGGNEAGQRILHGWVEVKQRREHYCIDGSNRALESVAVLPADAYYRLGEIVPENLRRYSLDGVLEIGEAVGHCGAWELPLEPCVDMAELLGQEQTPEGYYVGQLGEEY